MIKIHFHIIRIYLSYWYFSCKFDQALCCLTSYKMYMSSQFSRSTEGALNKATFLFSFKQEVCVGKQASSPARHASRGPSWNIQQKVSTLLLDSDSPCWWLAGELVPVPKRDESCVHALFSCLLAFDLSTSNLSSETWQHGIHRCFCFGWWSTDGG